MIEEELRKEAISTTAWECTPMIDRPLFVRAYITGAEPREKRIDELEKQNKELHQKITYLENDKEDILANWYCDKVGKCKVAELEAQIEKMKCCTNCKYYSMEFLPYFCIKNQIPTHCTEHCDKWELREIEENDKT